MLTIFIIVIVVVVIGGSILAAIGLMYKGAKDAKNSETITCLKCGNEYTLMYGGSDCPKCKTRNYKDSNGNLMM